MANPSGTMSRRLRDRKYGSPVVVVSGLPRSGTSMMMQMLAAGGLEIMTDGERSADEDNPQGYLEFERVKNLEKERDKGWVREARGKVLKVISFLLKDLPDENRYHVIHMRRDLDEVLASQAKMLERRGEKDTTEAHVIREAYLNQIAHVRTLARTRQNFAAVEIAYKDAVKDPAAAARQVNKFLGGILDEAKMVAAVNEKLYRNRAEKR